MMTLTTLFIIFAAVIGSAAMVGVLAFLMNRIRQVEARSLGSAGTPDQLLDQLRALQEDLLRVEDRVEALSERVDFTERLLMPGDSPSGPGDDLDSDT